MQAVIPGAAGSAARLRVTLFGTPEGGQEGWTGDWEEFGALFETPEARQSGGWCPVQYPAVGPERDRIWCVVLDVRDGTPLGRLSSWLKWYRYVAHALPGHSARLPRYRVILPLLEPIHGSDWPMFCRLTSCLVMNGHGRAPDRQAHRRLDWPAPGASGRTRVLRNEGRWVLPDDIRRQMGVRR
jgi:hypothetical protein